MATFWACVRFAAVAAFVIAALWGFEKDIGRDKRIAEQDRKVWPCLPSQPISEACSRP